jgi:hypothetical protein
MLTALQGKEEHKNETGNVRINVTLSSVHVTSAAVEKQLSVTYSECVCSLRYPACDAHAPYCHLWSVWFYSIFSHYLINGTIFEKKKYLT